MGDFVRARTPDWLAEFVMFGLKMGWAALFGGLILAAIIVSSAVWPENARLARYDFLFFFAVSVQGLFLWFRLETVDEAKVILLFHLSGTVMEWFKVSAGSWGYPEEATFVLFNVPLFSGFMYASVGSFIVRATRIFSMEFAPYPRLWLTWLLAAAIYVNFFSHHVLPDMRLALFLGTALVFGRTMVGFTVGARYRMPMVLAAVLSSFFLWVAENIGTLTGSWFYHGHTSADVTPISKMGSWYLLLFVAFATVTIVMREPLKRSQS